jgi:two-component system response regulator NreC
VSPASQMQIENAADRTIRCILAHPQVLLREGVCRLLLDEMDLEVVAEAGNATETLQRVSEHRPHVVIADAAALGTAPEELERLIRKASPATKIVFLSLNRHEPEDQAAAVGAGAAPQPTVMAQTSAEELVKMVRGAVAEGGPSLSAPSLCETPRRGRNSTRTLTPQQQTLTTREREVLKLLAEGRTVRSAALVLGVSAKTVDAHKFNLMRKLGLHNKVDLVVSAIRMGVLKVPANF